MAGLLDIFGTGGADTMGLLGMSASDISRNREDAQAQALYALAGRLFQGGNTGQSIVEGLQQGQKAYKGGMQDTLQSQLQNVQLADMIRKRKLEQQQLAEQQRIQGVIQGAVTNPQEMYGEDMMGQRVGEGMTAPSFDLQRAMPQLMSSVEGRKALGELIASNKAMRPDTFSLAENATQFERDPFTGQTKAVATGLPKKEKEDVAGDLKEARQFLGITTPVNEMTTTERALVRAYVDRKDAGRVTKVALDIGESTAVAKQKLATLNQWQGTLKDTGDTVVAGRASAFYDAYGKAKTGNTSADGALIYNIAKVYDQTGAVQQGDVNTIIGNRSIPTNIQLFAQKLLKGGTFTPKERDDLKSIVDGIVEERQKSLAPTINVYRGLNSALGGKPEEIINPYDTVRQSGGATDLASQAKAELARRKKEVNK
tara:strand:+ start:801 stop:2081 length:1281 start_codon:yes stop_codon:yes gene_type:complete